MLSIQPITLRTRDKELAAICTGTTVCHGKQAWSRVSKFKIFICKWTPVNTGDSSTIAINKISTLNHEILYDPVEGASFVSYRNAVFSEFSSAELPKVLSGYRGQGGKGFWEDGRVRNARQHFNNNLACVS